MGNAQSCLFESLSLGLDKGDKPVRRMLCRTMFSYSAGGPLWRHDRPPFGMQTAAIVFAMAFGQEDAAEIVISSAAIVTLAACSRIWARDVVGR